MLAEVPSCLVRHLGQLHGWTADQERLVRQELERPDTPSSTQQEPRYLPIGCRAQDHDYLPTFVARVNAARPRTWSWCELAAAKGDLTAAAVGLLLEEVFLEEDYLSRLNAGLPGDHILWRFSFAARCHHSNCEHLVLAEPIDQSASSFGTATWSAPSTATSWSCSGHSEFAPGGLRPPGMALRRASGPRSSPPHPAALRRRQLAVGAIRPLRLPPVRGGARSQCVALAGGPRQDRGLRLSVCQRVYLLAIRLSRPDSRSAARAGRLRPTAGGRRGYSRGPPSWRGSPSSATPCSRGLGARQSRRGRRPHRRGPLLRGRSAVPAEGRGRARPTAARRQASPAAGRSAVALAGGLHRLAGHHRPAVTEERASGLAARPVVLLHLAASTALWGLCVQSPDSRSIGRTPRLGSSPYAHGGLLNSRGTAQAPATSDGTPFAAGWRLTSCDPGPPYRRSFGPAGGGARRSLPTFGEQSSTSEPPPLHASLTQTPSSTQTGAESCAHQRARGRRWPRMTRRVPSCHRGGRALVRSRARISLHARLSHARSTVVAPGCRLSHSLSALVPCVRSCTCSAHRPRCSGLPQPHIVFTRCISGQWFGWAAVGC